MFHLFDDFVAKTLKLLILAIVLSAPTLFAQSGLGPDNLPAIRKQASTDRPTSPELNRITAKVKQGFAGAQKTRAPQIAAKQDIYAASIILQHGDTHTVIPPLSIIHTPPHLEKHITRTPHGKYMPWPEFYTANRRWIFTHHITINQAEGKAPIKDEVKKQFTRINRIVVTLFQNYPVSTLPAQ